MARPEVTGRRLLGDQSDKDKPFVVSMAKAGFLLDCGHDQVYALIKARELDSYTEGPRRKILMASIERLIAKRLAATGGEYQRSPKIPPVPRKHKKAAA
jgi:hypothetical protein